MDYADAEKTAALHCRLMVMASSSISTILLSRCDPSMMLVMIGYHPSIQPDICMQSLRTVTPEKQTKDAQVLPLSGLTNIPLPRSAGYAVS